LISLSRSREDAIMLKSIPSRRLATPRPIVAVLAFVFLALATRAFAGDVILFTASTDNSGGLNPISVPNNNNANIPAVSPSVTITPNPALLDGNSVGPLNGVTYGPFGFGGNAGGTTGFVNVSYTFTSAGEFQLVWEVSSVTGSPEQSALATDDVLLNGTALFNFQPDGLGDLPTGLTGAGTYGTSGAITGLSPSGGDSAFAWIDTSGGQTPVYDAVDGNSASQIYSATFIAIPGDVISLDAAFLTNDGGQYADYGIVALTPARAAVPLPSVLAQAAIGMAALYGMRRRWAAFSN
jgi:hypothetical protein